MYTRDCGVTGSGLARCRNGIGSNLGPTPCNDVKMVLTSVMLGAIHKQLKLGGMTWPKIGATHCYEQLGPTDKGRAIKGLVV